MIPVLHTQRLTLRAPERRDFAAFAEFYASDRSVWAGGPLTAKAAFQSFAALLGHWHLMGFGWWMVERDGAVVGFSGIHEPPYKPGPELGWVLYAGHEGQGLAREASAAGLRYAREVLRPRRLLSYIVEGNAPSERLASALGAVARAAPAEHDAEVRVWEHDLGARA